MVSLTLTAIEGIPVVKQGDDLALLQYTSGSTGRPKGVMLTHANLLANIRAFGEALALRSDDFGVSWLPLYHDMGLIGAWLGSLYYAAPVAILSPLHFLARPEDWLWAIHRYRATLSAAPNVAFELCLRKVDDADIAGLKLGSLRMVMNGAEAVSPDTVRNFTRRFSSCGLRERAVAPVYGLAECAVGLAFPPPDRVPIIDRVERRALTERGEAAAQAIVADGGVASFVRTDVSSSADVKAMVATAVERYGRLDIAHNNAGIVGGGAPLACGAALTAKTLKTGGVAIAFGGDGASNQGTTAESMNLATVWNLPVVFVVEDNGYAESTASAWSVGGEDLGTLE